MKYRKFSADYLFTGTSFLTDYYVLITDENGKVVDTLPASEAGDHVEKFSGILCPGFINAHCHLELSHLKNHIPERTGLTEFVYKVVTERFFDEKEILDSMEWAQKEMVTNGIVAVGDICNNTLSLEEKKRGLLDYYNFIEVSGWNPPVATMRFEKSKSYYDDFIRNGQKSSLVPHAPYSVSRQLWGKIAPFFPGKVITIHSQETKDEDAFFLEGTGDVVEMYKKMKIDNSFYTPPKSRSLKSYFKNCWDAKSVILVHNTFIKQEDLNYLKEDKPKEQLLSFCICVNANLYIENTLPPIEMLLENNCNVVIGTDSLASNHQLSILEEIKTISKNFPAIPVEILLQWATLNGAKALEMDEKLGSFQKGKQPGIVVIENAKNKNLTEDSFARKIL